MEKYHGLDNLHWRLSNWMGLTWCREILHVKGILIVLGVQVDLPIIIHCDNVGAIYLARNKARRRTKHLDAKFHFVRDYIEDGVVSVVFVQSEENHADPFTKNGNEGVYRRHFNFMRSSNEIS